MHWVRHLDDNQAHRARKRRMPNHSHPKLIVVVAVMIFAEAHHVGGFPRV